MWSSFTDMVPEIKVIRESIVLRIKKEREREEELEHQMHPADIHTN